MIWKKYEELKATVISQLESHLLPGLFYHSAGHTLDVISAAERIGKAENISDKEMLLLKVTVIAQRFGYITLILRACCSVISSSVREGEGNPTELLCRRPFY